MMQWNRLENDDIKLEIKEFQQLNSGHVGYRAKFTFLEKTGLDLAEEYRLVKV